MYVSTGQGVLGYNMFAYCNNNAVINIDITGTIHVKGTDACGIVSEDSFSVGYSSYFSRVKDELTINNIFVGISDGTGYTIAADTCQDADLILFNQISSESGSIFDYKLGVNINIKNGGIRIAGNLASCSISVIANNTSVEYFYSPTKTGITIAQGVDYKNLTAEKYVQLYFRPITIKSAFAICYVFPIVSTFFASYAIETFSKGNLLT